MNLILWIYELSYMWKSLVLSAYQSDHSYRQDSMKAAQPLIDYKFPINSYAVLWDLLCPILCPRPKFVVCDYTLHVVIDLFFQNRVHFFCDWFPHIERVKSKYIFLEILWAKTSSLSHSLDWSKLFSPHTWFCIISSLFYHHLSSFFIFQQLTKWSRDILVDVSRDWWLNILE